MMKLRTPLFLGAIAIALALGADVSRADPGHDPVRHGRIDLVASAGSGATGRFDAEIKPARGSHAEATKLRIKLRGLAAGEEYTLWGVDPASATLTQFGSVTAREDGHADFRIDTHHGDALPFGASLDDLAGGALEVHDSTGGVVLSSTFPDILPPKGPPLKGRADLTSNVPGASGRVETQFKPGDSHKPAQSKLKIKLHHLARDSEYTLWGIDPATLTLSQFGSVTTHGEGDAEFKVDTKHGDSLPFGASLADLAGTALEVHDASGAVALSGTFPGFASHGPKGKADLVADVPGARGRIEEEFKAGDSHHGPESKLKIKLEGLEGDSDYSLWGIEPATLTLTQFGTVTTKKDGKAEFSVDTHHGDSLPFGASLEDLAGTTLEVRDASGAVVLHGTFPSPTGDVVAPPPPPPPATGTGHTDLTAPVAGPTGAIDTDFDSTAASSQVTVALHGLVPGTMYSLWVENPTTLAIDVFGSVTADASGNATLSIDTSTGGTLPFGATLDLLANGEFEVHDPAAVVVLQGTFPVTQ